MKMFAKLLTVTLTLAIAFPAYMAYAEEQSTDGQEELVASTVEADVDSVEVSEEGEAALISDATFAVDGFSRAQRGSNREVDDSYIGYRYYQGSSADKVVAVATEEYVVVYVPASLADFVDIEDEQDQALLKSYFVALDEASVNGGVVLGTDIPWYFTEETSITISGIMYSFAVEASEGSYYVTVLGEDGSDIVSADSSARPTHVDFLELVESDVVEIVQAATGIAAVKQFLSNLDWSPLWVTLKTTGVAIVFIFVLGLAAAYFSLRIPKRAQDLADTLFTIPMVLPPTVCGFVLLLALGNKSPVGRWFIEHGFSLVFSWPATVIAAAVVAFPLMYRSARGAFESIDASMLDAARTLGWSNVRIFFRLMLPLAWSSIAAGTVLAFARALGEFGATLFLAGNYAGITRTIPIAIYFEWMSGDTTTALFWTGVVIVFSFLVILFINLWSKRTTKYRRRDGD